jgi:hypothetical protein
MLNCGMSLRNGAYLVVLTSLFGCRAADGQGAGPSLSPDAELDGLTTDQSGDEPAPSQGLPLFDSVSIEEGGFCMGQGPCWRRVVVASSGEVRLERPQGTRGSPMETTDLASVTNIADEPEFRGAVASARPTCPVVSDFQVIVKLVTASGESQDPHAAGCIISDALRATHPYPRLRVTLQRVAVKYLGEGLYEE